MKYITDFIKESLIIEEQNAYDKKYFNKNIYKEIRPWLNISSHYFKSWDELIDGCKTIGLRVIDSATNEFTIGVFADAFIKFFEKDGPMIKEMEKTAKEYNKEFNRKGYRKSDNVAESVSEYYNENLGRVFHKELNKAWGNKSKYNSWDECVKDLEDDVCTVLSSVTNMFTDGAMCLGLLEFFDDKEDAHYKEMMHKIKQQQEKNDFI